MQTALRRNTETGNEKDPSAALGMTKRDRYISHSFSIRHGSQPPPLRGTSFRGKEGESPLPIAKPFPRIVISSESEKSFSFAVRKSCEGIGERETPYPTFMEYQASRFRSHAHTASYRERKRFLAFARNDTQTDRLASSFIPLRGLVPLRDALSHPYTKGLLLST